MAKQLKDILAGKKASKVTPGSTGSEPGVDYAPKPRDEQDFVKKHSIEKHDDRVGNGDDVYQATNIKHSLTKPGEERHGHKTPKDKKVYEAAKCNMTEAGTACPVHEMADCTKKPLKEVLTKKTPAGEWIKDFQKSKDPKFAGKSPEKRKQMALAAYYDKQRNEEVESVDEAKLSPEDFLKGARRAGSGTNDQLKADTKRKNAGPGSGKIRQMARDELKRRGIKEEEATESLAVPLIGSNGDGDESAEMAKAELKAIANKALHLVMQIPDSMTVEPWVQSKIAKAKEQISAVHDYMVYGDHEEQTAPYEGGVDMSSGAVRNTFPNFSADVNTGRNV